MPKEFRRIISKLCRDGKTQKEKDPVLDTMISVIQVETRNKSCFFGSGKVKQ